MQFNSNIQTVWQPVSMWVWVPILGILFLSYLPLSLQPSTSLMFPAAMPPSCQIWGSCCGRWSQSYPPCKTLPDHTSPAARWSHRQLSQLYLLSQVQAWQVIVTDSGFCLISVWNDWAQLKKKFDLIVSRFPSGWVWFGYCYFKELLLPHKIHAKKSFITICTLSAPHRFVSNAHLMLICTHLCPPQPRRSAQYYCIRVGNLLDLNVCALVIMGTGRYRSRRLVKGALGAVGQ